MKATMKDKVIAVVQARMDSSRFPGKSLAKVGEWSIIELVLKRVNQSSRIENVSLATSVNPMDDILEKHVHDLGFPVSRGSEEDVLTRFYVAAKVFDPTIVVRITGDCPMISPKLIDHAIDSFIDQKSDYLTISIGEEKELAYPRGFDVEVASFEALSEAVVKATKKYEREHVMPYLYTHDEKYSTRIIEPKPEESRPNYRLCVDTKQDLEVILKLHEFFGAKLIDTNYLQIIQFLDENPSVAEINQSVEQRHFTQVDSRMG